MEKKRDYTRFFTYPETADFMADLFYPIPGEVYLEPSAGNGALIKAVKSLCPESKVVAVELYEEWKDELKNCADEVFIKDFLWFDSMTEFDGCIANPPFGNGTNLVEHINAMRALVKRGGRMVILVPDDYDIDVPHDTYPLENWSKNSDGTTTPIKIISFLNI